MRIEIICLFTLLLLTLLIICNCRENFNNYLSVYDGFTERPNYQKLTKGTYGHIKQQMPIVVAEIAQYITKKYDLEYTEISKSNTLSYESNSDQRNAEILQYEILQ